MTAYHAPLAALFGRVPSEEEHAAAVAQASRLDAGIFANPLLLDALACEDVPSGVKVLPQGLVDLPRFEVPKP
ncbi:MAG: hypothetical protein AAF576_02195 [Pseudomonadota bacterium]